MIIEKYFLFLTNLCCHSVKKFVKKIFYLNTSLKKPPTQAHFDLGGSSLHSGGSWRPGVPSLIISVV